MNDEALIILSVWRSRAFGKHHVYWARKLSQVKILPEINFVLLDTAHLFASLCKEKC